MKLAVLMGAGASFGCGNVDPEAPPLGNQLFEKLKRALPDSWGSLLTSDENDVFRCDFEQGMAQIRRKPAAQRLLIDMALYFSTFRATGPNCYSRLLELLDRTPDLQCVFCTLNYDLLLEQAITSNGRSLWTLGRTVGVVGPPPVAVLKPHGSCNYIHPLTRNVRDMAMSESEHYLYTESSDPSQLEIVCADELSRIYTEVGLSLPPAISLYEPKKHHPVASKVIEGFAPAGRTSRRRLM